jgi:hypothetical protein
MKTECTDLFARYREIARLVWNLGFWPNLALREYAGVDLYQEAVTRLFEAMIILPLGCQGRIEDRYYPGHSVEFKVEITTPEVDLLVNKNPQNEPAKIWGRPTIRLKPGKQQLRFMAFFDWNQIAVRDFQYVEVQIEQLDGNPELVGRHAILPFDRCSIWTVTDESGGCQHDDSRK